MSANKSQYEAEIREKLQAGIPVARIAKDLGIHRNTLYLWMREMDIDPKLERKQAS